MLHYSELSEVLSNLNAHIRIRYTELYRILCVVLEEATAQAEMDFSGPFARLTFACQNGQIERQIQYPLNALRRRCLALQEHTEQELIVLLPKDVGLVAELVRQVSGQPVPDTLSAYLPTQTERPSESQKHTEWAEKLRVSVLSWDENFIIALPDGELENPIRIDYTRKEKGYAESWAHIGPLLHVGSQLGLLHCRFKDGLCLPEIIILEPDYLVDVSAVAGCFKAYGTSHYAHLINRLGEKENTSHTLLGNLAGQLLDEEVNRRSESTDYIAAARRFMHQNILPLLSVGQLPADFHRAAQNQQTNLRKMWQQAILHDHTLEPDHVLLEASFLCEALGLQGRMDLITDDCRVLMEQKSGKRDEFRHKHQEAHYVQMLLYQAMLHYGHGLRNDEISCYLLYSKYPDGLLKESSAPELLRKALQIRNRIVWIDFHLSRGGTQLLEYLSPEHLRGEECSERFWKEYARDPLANLLERITQASPLAKAYYHRMMAFVAQEHLLAKIGAPGREADGMAALWRSPLEEKLVAGNILMGLEILQTETDEQGGTEKITFRLSEQQGMGMPNFRVGDIVVCYAYPADRVPDVRRAIVFRSIISRFDMDAVQIQLRNPQRNTHVFQPVEGQVWAVEHDCMESGFSGLYRSLYAILTTSEPRRQLLLNQRPPERDTSISLLGDYSMGGTCPHFNQLVLQARQAKDYFILIGPPGTGKTSFGLVNILLETLRHPGETALLLSYTNRAVDEMCSKLVQHGVDFIRVGRHATCDAVYHSYLLEERVKDLSGIGDAGRLLEETRVIVSTTSSLTSHSELLRLKTFDVALIDEASQILEPHLMGILCATRQGEPSVRKFVLIGDHKQLPAVVQQSVEMSLVHEEILKTAGLEDCRESLFQRLIRLQENTHGESSPYIYRFTQQGRMHPDVARFAVEQFYEGRLSPIPLPHQQRDLHFPIVEEGNALQRRLATERVIFFPSRLPEDNLSPKTNTVEARMVAQVILNVYRLYTQNGKPFSSQETVGVIVPYRLQIAQVLQEIARLGIPELNHITVDTVERYQGSERDVIIYGFTVRYPHQLQFLCSQTFTEHGHPIDRKLNVALTRAREQLVLIGHPETLCLDDLHRKLIKQFF